MLQLYGLNVVISIVQRKHWVIHTLMTAALAGWGGGFINIAEMAGATSLSSTMIYITKFQGSHSEA